MPLKIAMLGAGSTVFARQLVQDILTVPELQDSTFSLMDINPRNLQMVERLCRRDIDAHKLPTRIETFSDARKAVADADYIFCMIRQGGLPAFETDVDIPLKYGVDQCVGDTLAPGGLMYAQRTIPALLGFCRHIREVAKPGALLMNYSNPMAMNTRACAQYGGVRVVGLCHGVQGAHWQITECIERWAKREKLMGPDEKLHRRDVDVIAAGINHQTWFVQVKWRGMDMTPKMLELFEAHPTFPKTEKVRIDVLRRFGYYSTESNGHFSEYVPWYRKRPREIRRWIDLSCWINGETGGYLRVCTEKRNWFETDFPKWLKEEPAALTPEKRSEEHGSYIIEALETGRPYRGHFNIINKGHVSNLPDGCAVEIPAYVDANGISVPVVGDLPLACAATCSASIRVQEMGVEAAVHGDISLLKQAMLHDPLTAAVCNPEEVWQMADEMVVAQRQWLPQFGAAIKGAEARLKKHVRDGTRVKLSSTKGAARLRARSVKEVAESVAGIWGDARTAGKRKTSRKG